MKKSLFATFIIAALCTPGFSQEKPQPPATKIAAVTTYTLSVGQKLIYKTLLPPEIHGGDLTPGQEHVTVAAIGTKTITLKVKLYKESAESKILELKEQGTLDWEPVPEPVMKALFAKEKDKLKKVSVVVGSSSFACVRVPLGPMQVAWIAVDEDLNNVFPGVLKMTFDDDPTDTKDPVTIMELVKIE